MLKNSELAIYCQISAFDKNILWWLFLEVLLSSYVLLNSDIILIFLATFFFYLFVCFYSKKDPLLFLFVSDETIPMLAHSPF